MPDSNEYAKLQSDLEWARYFHRLRLEIDALARLQQTLEPGMFARFVQNYSRHYVCAIECGEKPVRAGDYLREFAEIEKLGRIEFDADFTTIHESRNYGGLYNRPRLTRSENGNGSARRKARRTLGLDAPGPSPNGDEVKPEPIARNSARLEPALNWAEVRPVQQALF